MLIDTVMPNLYRIYTLSDPRTNEVRYVGITVNSLVCRLGNHIRQSRAGENTYKARWVRKLLSEETRPVINLVEETEDFLRECFWIKSYKDQGAQLVNSTDGAHAGTHLSEEVKRNMKTFHRLHPLVFTTEIRQRIGDAHRGKPVLQSTKDKLHLAHLGKKYGSMPEKNRKKISIAKMGKSPSLATRLKIKATLTGRKRGPRVTHCKYGHEYTQGNTFINIRGNRECRICLHLRDLKFHPRRNIEVVGVVE